MNTAPLARFLIGLGAILIVLGVLLMFLPKIPVLGKLPGDIYIKRKNFIFYFPVATSLLVSVILWLFFSIWRRH